MIVMVLEKVSASVRGELTRWLIQPRTGVFVGNVSARVRDKLWEKAASAKKGGAAILIYSDDTEQGFSVRSHGDTSRTMTDFEGLILPKVPVKG